MYIVSLVLLVVCSAAVSFLSGTPFRSVADMSTLILLLALTVIVLFGAGLLGQFFRSFGFAFSKVSGGADGARGSKKPAAEVKLPDMKRSLEAVDLAIGTFVCAGVFVAVIGFVAILWNTKDPAFIGPNFSVALLSVLYGLFFTFVLLPVRARLKVRIVSWADEA